MAAGYLDRRRIAGFAHHILPSLSTEVSHLVSSSSFFSSSSSFFSPLLAFFSFCFFFSYACPFSPSSFGSPSALCWTFNQLSFEITHIETILTVVSFFFFFFFFLIYTLPFFLPLAGFFVIFRASLCASSLFVICPFSFSGVFFFSSSSSSFHFLPSFFLSLTPYIHKERHAQRFLAILRR